MNTLHESSKRTAARWARISQLPRKLRRHQTRQELRRIDRIFEPVVARRITYLYPTKQEQAGLIRNLMRQDGL